MDPSPELMDEVIEDFIRENQVDGSAADALREATRTVQQAVIERGGLSGARNPSSVLLARIRDAATPPIFADGDPDGVGVVRLRGIPFSATKEDILRFFESFEPMAEGVVIGTTREGRLSGEAFVQFPTKDLAREAIESKNRASMGDRYIELFPSTAGEAQRAQHSGPVSSRWGDDRGGYTDWSTYTSDRYITEEEVEDWIASNNVDDHAAASLRELPRTLQAGVIDRGGLGNARNPSSVLLSRIRDAQAAHSRGPPPEVPLPPPPAGRGSRNLAERVERFVAECGIDEQAAEVLRKSHPDVQEEIIQRNDVAQARNPSSALRARIRDVESALMASPARPSQAPASSGRPGGNLVARVEEFIASNRVDDRAAETLRSQQGHVQTIVIDRGDLVGTRNPSSALLARIKDAQYAAPPPGRGGGGGRPSSLEDAIEGFIRFNYIDERAAEMLRGCPPAMQEAVLERGDVVNTRNPSSTLLARIRDVQAGIGPGRPPHGPFMSPAGPPMGGPPIGLPASVVDDIEYLLRAYADRDERAADLLQRVRSVKFPMGPPGMGPPGMGPPGMGPPGPAGGFREGDAFDGYRGQPPLRPLGRESRSFSPRGRRPFVDGGPLDGEDRIDAYCRANGVDAAAQDTLRRVDPTVAQVVMEKGVGTARNPSSALLARIRDVESRMATNSNGRDRGHDAASHPRKRSRLEDDVEAFIRSNGVDEMAADALRRCSPDVQEAVMEKGVGGARNPSSALLARIRDAEQGRLGDRRRRGGGGDRYVPY